MLLLVLGSWGLYAGTLLFVCATALLRMRMRVSGRALCEVGQWDAASLADLHGREQAVAGGKRPVGKELKRKRRADAL